MSTGTDCGDRIEKQGHILENVRFLVSGLSFRPNKKRSHSLGRRLGLHKETPSLWGQQVVVSLPHRPGALCEH